MSSGDIEHAIGETVAEAVEEHADPAPEVVEDTTVVVVEPESDDGGEPIAEANEAVEFVERVRAIAREEAYSATSGISSGVSSEYVDQRITEALAAYDGAKQQIPSEEPPSPEEDEPPAMRHPWYRPLRRR